MGTNKARVARQPDPPIVLLLTLEDLALPLPASYAGLEARLTPNLDTSVEYYTVLPRTISRSLAWVDCFRHLCVTYVLANVASIVRKFYPSVVQRTQEGGTLL